MPLPLVHGRREKSTIATTVIVVVDAHPPASMPGLGATDPADLEAQDRAELGFSRRLEQPRRISPYPGVGGSGGYAVWYREHQLQRFDAGEAIDVSRRSIYRWADRLEPFRQTGNRERTTIFGVDLLNLVTGGRGAAADEWRRRQQQQEEGVAADAVT